jgi:hypothetical protein
MRTSCVRIRNRRELFWNAAQHATAQGVHGVIEQEPGSVLVAAWHAALHMPTTHAVLTRDCL